MKYILVGLIVVGLMYIIDQLMARRLERQVREYMSHTFYEKKTAVALAEAASWEFDIWGTHGDLQDWVVDIAMEYIKEID